MHISRISNSCTLLALGAMFASVCIRGCIEARVYQQAGQNITRALVEMTKESLLQAFGHDMKRKPSRSFTPHDYMIQVYTRLNSKIENQQRSNINTVRGIIDTGELIMFILYCWLLHIHGIFW